MNRTELEKLIASNITSEPVIKAFGDVDRRDFVSELYLDSTYEDHPLPIDQQQTISQPSLVAKMLAMSIHKSPRKNVLEIGTGSGYQTKLLSKLFDHVVSLERIEQLHLQAKDKLNDKNITLLCGDGYEGEQAFAPYDSIIVTAACPEIPTSLHDQVHEGGNLVIPINTMDEQSQTLYHFKKQKAELKVIEELAVRFVPMLPGIQKKTKLF